MVSASGVAPWTVTDTTGLRAFHDALTRYASNLAADGGAVIAWSSGELPEAAVDQLPAQNRVDVLTAALVTEGLGRIHDENLGGLTARLTFTPTQPHAVSRGCVYFERLTTAGWTAPEGSRPICTGP
jgi:hypothetical protein